MDEKTKHPTDYSQPVFINPYTDFGFKKLFGTEMNKDLLISFLNALFMGSMKEIVDIQYLNGEQLGDGYGERLRVGELCSGIRRAVFDVYCKTKDGSRFIVEMQKAEQEYFKDRSLYYATVPIREQAPKGHRLEDVYCVGILNFEFPNSEYPTDSYRHEIKLEDIEDHHVFYEKLTFLYLEIPKFNKTEDELVTMFDKWMFALRNLYRLLERPKALQDRIFQKLFDQAEIAKYSAKERQKYEESRKDYWDYYSTVTTAEKKGRVEGRAEGLVEGMEKGQQQEKVETIHRLQALGLTIEQIAQGVGLCVEEVKSIIA